MSSVADDIDSLRKQRALLRRRDGALRAAIRQRIGRSFRKPSAFAAAALLGAALGLLRSPPQPRHAPEAAMPPFARWIVIAAELSGPLLSLLALARRRRDGGDAGAERASQIR